MKKRVLFTTLLILTSVFSFAQKTRGTLIVTPKIGINRSSMTDGGTLFYNSVYGQPSVGSLQYVKDLHSHSFVCEGNAKSRTLLALGVEADYQLSSRLGLLLGVNYSQQGASFDGFQYHDANHFGISADMCYDDAKQNLDYIAVPFMGRFYVLPFLAVEAGVQPAFLIGKNRSGGVSENGVDCPLTSDNLDNIKNVAFSVPVGIAAEYRNLQIGLRWNIGMSKIYSSTNSYSFGTKNSLVQLTAGYRLKLF